MKKNGKTTFQLSCILTCLERLWCGVFVKTGWSTDLITTPDQWWVLSSFSMPLHPRYHTRPSVNQIYWWCEARTDREKCSKVRWMVALHILDSMTNRYLVLLFFLVINAQDINHLKLRGGGGIWKRDENFQIVIKQRKKKIKGANKLTHLAMMCFEPSIFHPTIPVY